MSDPLALTDRLLEMRPLTTEKIRQATGITLERRAESDEFSTIYGATGGGAIREIELRVPGRSSTAKGELLVLDLAPKSGITRDQVTARFGPDPVFAPPSPHAPPGSPSYLRYAKPWGAVRFGFGPETPESLVTIVIDATGDSQ